MDYGQLPDHYVYKPNVIEFITVVAETCLFLENTSELSKDEFVDKTQKILPLLYLKSSLLQAPEKVLEDGYLEQFVTEEDYNYVAAQIQNLLGEDDAYLEAFHPEMQYSDAPIASLVSENLADIYQEIKDLAGNYQTGEQDIMNDAIAACLESFGEHWGRKVLSALQALHSIKYKEKAEID